MDFTPGPDADTVHIYPLNDLVAHDTSDDEPACVCGPETRPAPRDDGSMGWVIVHQSLDGREARVMDLAPDSFGDAVSVPSQTGAIGVGMPAVIHLNAFAREITEAYGETCYLVGSAAVGKTWRDVDVRLMLDDDEFDTLFPAHRKPNSSNGRWSLICAAISELGRMRTGLPIDFQIQRSSDANAQYNGVRHALGVYLH